jgi:AraC-like DNA-binding protein
MAALPADTLSDVLQSVRLSGALFFLVDASTPWVAEAPAATVLAPVLLPRAQHIVSYHVIREGACWCESPGLDPVRLEAGDVLIVPHGHTYALTSAPGLRSGFTDDQTLGWFRDMSAGLMPFVVREGGSGPDRIRVICGFLGCDALPFNPVLARLPALLVVRLPTALAGDRLSTLMEFAVAESRDRGPGSQSVLLRIAELVFVEVVRAELTSSATADGGWLGGLRDPVVGRALARLHAEPAHAWTLAALAHDVGVSRSVLAQRFSHFVGDPPMVYLTRWRMQLAAVRLDDPAAKVAAVAQEVGYESEAAFSRAFKRLVGVPPAQWRRRSAAVASCRELSQSVAPAGMRAGSRPPLGKPLRNATS